MAKASIVRYSDSELEEFRLLIVDRYQKAKAELDDLRSQILDITESLEGDFGTDYIDDSSSVNNMEMLNNMAIRKRKYLQDLENAMIRIRNKTYGICSVTGDLIDRKRLLAVPTTTKSVLGKTQQTGGFTSNPSSLKRASADEEEEETEKPKKKQPKQPKIITRVIRKTNTNQPKPAIPVDDEEEEDDLGLDDELFGNLQKVNLEDVAEEAEDVADDSADDFADDEPYDDDDD